MDLATLILLALKVSIVLTVFGLTLKASLPEAIELFRRPGQLARALLAMNVVMPIFAVALITAFDLHPAVKIALVALSVSPIPPFLPQKALKAGGKESYIISLLVATALLAMVLIPLTLELLEIIFRVRLGISPMAVAPVVLVTILAPLMVGLVIHRLWPAFAERVARPISLAAAVALIASFLLILFTARSGIVSLVGNGTIIALAAFVIVGLIAGHLLGGPEAENRTVLALATASRHPGVAIAIAHANFPEQKLALAAILIYLLLGAVVSIPYLTWTKRHHAATEMGATMAGPSRLN